MTGDSETIHLVAKALPGKWTKVVRKGCDFGTRKIVAAEYTELTTCSHASGKTFWRLSENRDSSIGDRIQRGSSGVRLFHALQRNP